jgi:hypothetical protein
MDNHGAQTTQAFRAQISQYGIVPAYTPPDCTDVVAPVDHHVGARLKRIISQFYHDDLERSIDSWCMPAGLGGLSASQRRMYMAQWVAAAWHVIREDADFLRNAFVSTGFLIAKDGSENNKIKLAGITNYDFTIN